MIRVQVIDEARKQDLALPNEPFPIYGRLIPRLEDGIWSYETRLLPPEEVTSLCFPDETYQLSEQKVFMGAYEGETCVGLAVLEDAWFRYLYLADLKVSAAWRRKGAGQVLIRAALETAKARGYGGVYTIAQDNNLDACRFYLAQGFRIGGFDNQVYTGTSQAGKADLYFYLDL